MYKALPHNKLFQSNTTAIDTYMYTLKYLSI